MPLFSKLPCHFSPNFWAVKVLLKTIMSAMKWLNEWRKVFCNLIENWSGYSIIEFIVFWYQLLSYCWTFYICLGSVHCTSTDCKCDVCINFHRLRVPTTQLTGWSWNVRNGFTHADCPQHNCHHGKPNCWHQWVGESYFWEESLICYQLGICLWASFLYHIIDIIFGVFSFW